MDLAVRALSNFQKLLQASPRQSAARGCDQRGARGASNRAEFFARIRRETGITVEVISGADEARLIFDAARHALGLEGGPHLLVDVGGGSVELVLVRDGEADVDAQRQARRLARLTEQFLTRRSADARARLASWKRIWRTRSAT